MPVVAGVIYEAGEADSWPTPDPSLHITSVLCTEFLSGPRQVVATICLQKKF